MADVVYTLGSELDPSLDANIKAAEAKFSASAQRMSAAANNAADSDRAARIRKIQQEAAVVNEKGFGGVKTLAEEAAGATEKLGTSLNAAGKQAAAAGVHLANAFVPGIQQITSLLGSIGPVGAVAAVAVGVVTYALDHWFDKEEKLEALLASADARRRTAANDLAAAYEKAGKMVTEADEKQLAHEVLVAEGLQREVEKERDAIGLKVKYAKAGSEAEAALIKQGELLIAQAGDAAANVTKARAALEVATQDAANNAAATAGKERADEEARREEVQSQGRVARIQRQAARETATTHDKLESITKVRQAQNRVDAEIVASGATDASVAKARINNRNAEATAAIQSILLVRRHELEALERSARARVDAAKMARIEAENLRLFSEGKDSTLGTMQVVADAERASEEQRAQHALAALEFKKNVTLEERRQRIQAIADVEISAVSSEMRILRERMKYAVADGSLSQEAADERISAEQRAADARIAIIQGNADFTVAQNTKKLASEHDVALAQYETAASTIAMGVAMSAVNPVIDLMTSKLQFLGEINRENAADMLKFTDETPAMMAKQAQAVLAGIAISSAGEALKHGAAAAGQLAFGIGAAAIGSPSAAGHFASAAEHAVTAGMYGVLAGTAGGGALAVASTRGEGGLVGLTPEENKAKRDKEAASRGGGGGSGPSVGRNSGNRGGGDDGHMTVNINYNNSIAPGADDRRIVPALARGMRAARRDGFAQRAMRPSGG